MKKTILVSVVFSLISFSGIAQMPQSGLPRFIRWVDNNQFVLNTKEETMLLQKITCTILLPNNTRLHQQMWYQPKKRSTLKRGCLFKRKWNRTAVDI